MVKRAVIGVDIGGTKTLCILFNENFRIMEEIKFKTSPTEGRQRFTAKLTQSIKTLAKQAKSKNLELIGAGIGFAGQVNTKKSTIEVAPNMLHLENYALGKVFKEAAGLDTIMGNDVQMGLYGEYQLGVAAGCSHVLGVFFGTGIGGAAIIDGKLYRGASGLGGQVGCILTQSLGGPETAQTHGILDRIASKTAIAGDAAGMAAKHWAPYLFKVAGTDLSKITWRVLSNSIKNGDKVIKEMIQSRLKSVGHALSSVVNFLNPDMVVLGGGLTEEMPKLVLNQVESGIRDYLVPEVSESVRVVVARLKNRAGAFGAAKMAFEKFS